MQQSFFDEIFHVFSKMIIVVPVVIVIMALFMRFTQKTSPLSFNQTVPAPTVHILPTSASVSASSSIRVMLDGPFVCNYNSKDATVNAYIKSKNVQAILQQQNNTTHIILANDCVYFWDNKKITGAKMCGLSPYISLFGQIPINSLLGNSSLPIPSLVQTQSLNVSEILKSCKKQDFNTSNYFKIPQNIVFTEQKLF